MKDLLAGILFFVFIGLLTYGALDQGKQDQFKRWCKMSINFERKHIIERESKINEIDPDFVRAIIWIESQGDSKAISVTGCKGIGQVNKGNAKYFGYEHKEMHDDEKNLMVMLRLIKESRDFYQGEAAKAIRKQESLQEWILREYNVGRGIAMKNFLAGKSYAKMVLLAYKAIKSGSFQMSINNRVRKIDLAKINGEA